VAKKVKKNFPPSIPPSSSFSRQFPSLFILQSVFIDNPNEISPKNGGGSGEHKNAHNLTRKTHAGSVFREVLRKGGSA